MLIIRCTFKLFMPALSNHALLHQIQTLLDEMLVEACREKYLFVLFLFHQNRVSKIRGGVLKSMLPIF